MGSFTAGTMKEIVVPFSISDLWNTVYRRRKLVIAIVLAFFFMGVVFSKIAPKKYEAEAVILIGSQEKNLEIKSVLSEVPNDITLIPSEIQVLISRNLMGQVLDFLDVPNHPEKLFGGKVQQDSSYSKMDESEKKEYKEGLVDFALAHLDVKQIEKSRAISVTYTSKNPEVAAIIVNKLTEMYIEQQISNNFEAVRLTNSWLSERVDELQKKVVESERKIADYRAKTGLVDSRGSDLIEQNITDLSLKLTDAKAKLSDTESKLTEIKDLKKLDSAPSVLSSVLIQKLRESEAEARNQLASLSDKMGPEHPEYMEAKARVTAIQSKITQEITKIAEGLRRENQVAQENVSLIAQQIENLKKDYNADKSNDVGLSELEREAETNRKFLETLNLRWKETQSQEDARLQMPYARIISAASIPTSPASPKLKLILAVVLFVGSAFGVAIAIALDQMQGTVYNGKQIQEMTGFTNISLVSSATSDKLKTVSNFADLPLKDSSSPYMDGIREISAFLKLEKNKNPSASVFNFTSSSEGEGKSALVASLARQLALEGIRVIAVDCDIRQADLSKIYAVGNQKGLTEILQQTISVHDGIVVDELTKLSIIPIGIDNDVNVMVQSSESWQKLLSKLAQDFDIVLLDSPPILSAPESKIISRLTNNIFCIRWKKTPLKVIGFALDTLKRTDSRVAGTVITMAEGKIASGQSYPAKAA